MVASRRTRERVDSSKHVLALFAVLRTLLVRGPDSLRRERQNVLSKLQFLKAVSHEMRFSIGEVAMPAIQTLAHLLMLNSETKKEFCAVDGWRTLGAQLASDEPVPSRALCGLLLGLLVDSQQVALDQARIANDMEGCLLLMLRLLTRCASGEQCAILASLTTLLSGQEHIANLSVCRKLSVSLSDRLLDCIEMLSPDAQREAIAVVKTVGSRGSISVRQTKRLFQLMHNTFRDGRYYRAALTPYILAALQDMLRDSRDNTKAPQHYFSFDGVASGLQLVCAGLGEKLNADAAALSVLQRPQRAVSAASTSKGSGASSHDAGLSSKRMERIIRSSSSSHISSLAKEKAKATGKRKGKKKISDLRAPAFRPTEASMHARAAESRRLGGGIPRWPKGAGYTVCCWIRADSFPSDDDMRGVRSHSKTPTKGGAASGRKTDQPSGTSADAARVRLSKLAPHVFSFLDHRDRGVELFLLPSSVAKTRSDEQRRRTGHKRRRNVTANLVFRIANDDRSGGVIKDTGFALQERRWYFITLCHWRHSGIAQIYVDGVQRWRESRIPYPPGAATPYCCVGSSANSRLWSDEQQLRQTRLHGQMGMLAMFAEPLSEALVSTMYKLGSDCMLGFDSSITNVRRDGFSAASGFRARADSSPADGGGKPAFLFAITPRIYRETLFLDASNDADRYSRWGFKSAPSRARRSSLDAGLPGGLGTAPVGVHAYCDPDGGTHEVFTRRARAMMDCVGGIRMLFPLFAMLDLDEDPLASSFGDDTFSAQLNAASDDRADVQNVQRGQYLVDQILNILALVLLKNETDQQFMRRSKGIAVIAYLLERVSPQNLTFESLDAIQKMLECVEDDEELTKDVSQLLLCNWRPWVCTEVKQQEKLAEDVRDMIDKKPLKWWKVVGAHRLLDVLEMYYEYPVAKSSHGARAPALAAALAPPATPPPKKGAAVEDLLQTPIATGGRRAAGSPNSPQQLHRRKVPNEIELQRIRSALLRAITIMLLEAAKQPSDTVTLPSLNAQFGGLWQSIARAHEEGKMRETVELLRVLLDLLPEQGDRSLIICRRFFVAMDDAYVVEILLTLLESPQRTLRLHSLAALGRILAIRTLCEPSSSSGAGEPVSDAVAAVDAAPQWKYRAQCVSEDLLASHIERTLSKFEVDAETYGAVLAGLLGLRKVTEGGLAWIQNPSFISVMFPLLRSAAPALQLEGLHYLKNLQLQGANCDVWLKCPNWQVHALSIAIDAECSADSATLAFEIVVNLLRHAVRRACHQSQRARESSGSRLRPAVALPVMEVGARAKVNLAGELENTVLALRSLCEGSSGPLASFRAIGATVLIKLIAFVCEDVISEGSTAMLQPEVLSCVWSIASIAERFTYFAGSAPEPPCAVRGWSSSLSQLRRATRDMLLRIGGTRMLLMTPDELGSSAGGRSAAARSQYTPKGGLLMVYLRLLLATAVDDDGSSPDSIRERRAALDEMRSIVASPDLPHSESIAVPIVSLIVMELRRCEQASNAALKVDAAADPLDPSMSMSTRSAWWGGLHELLVTLLDQGTPQISELIRNSVWEADDLVLKNTVRAYSGSKPSGAVTSSLEVLAGSYEGMYEENDDEPIDMGTPREEARMTPSVTAVWSRVETTSDGFSHEQTRNELTRKLCLDVVWEVWTSQIDEPWARLTSCCSQDGGDRVSTEGLDRINRRARLLDEQQSRWSTDLSARAKATLEILLAEQRTRKDEVSREAQNDAQVAAHNWRRILRSVTNERGPWGKGSSDIVAEEDERSTGSSVEETGVGQKRVYWKLEGAVDWLQRRCKLKRNYHGTDHRQSSCWDNGGGASITKRLAAADASSADEGAGADAGSALVDREILNLLLVQDLSLAAEVGTGAGLEEIVKEQRQRHATLGAASEKQGDAPRAPQMSARVADTLKGLEEAYKLDQRIGKLEDETSGADRPPMRTGPDVQRSNEQIDTSFECDMVKPMKSWPGVLEVSNTHLRWYPEKQPSAAKAADGSEKQQRATPSRRGVADKDTLLRAPRSCDWRMEELRSVELRRYQLRHIALEFFFADKHSYLLNFKSCAARKFVYEIMRTRVRPPNVRFWHDVDSTPAQRLERTGLVSRWRHREISNFEFLMGLNRIAGRTYNDLAQYPIFPWVIADYTSSSLDLRKKSTFRDFRWPMGAQKKAQRVRFEKKYKDYLQVYNQMVQERQRGGAEAAEALQESFMFQGPPWHFGTHYSNPQAALWYLVRMEPFTSLHIFLQDGRFDRPDRQFDSIAAAWRGCTSNDADVKELIPEFFFLPEFLRNSSGLDLGSTQSGKQLGSVELPPWAQTPEDFVRANLAALESEFTSMHLHHWVNLVFGSMQRGPYLPRGSARAVERCNVFFHLTYEGAVDLEGLAQTNVPLFEKCISLIDNFGQTPPVLLLEKMKPRDQLHTISSVFPLLSRAALRPSSCCKILGAATAPYPPKQPQELIVWKPRENFRWTQLTRRTLDGAEASLSALIFIAEAQPHNKLITVDAGRLLGCHGWTEKLKLEGLKPFTITLDPHMNQAGRSRNHRAWRAACNHVGVGFAPRRFFRGQLVQDPSTLGPQLYAALSTPSLGRSQQMSTMLLSCGHWDNTWRVTDSETGRTIQVRSLLFYLTYTKSPVSLAITLIHTEYTRTSPHLFYLPVMSSLLSSPPPPTHDDTQSIEWHRDVVTCIAVTESGSTPVVATGSTDTTVMLWELAVAPGGASSASSGPAAVAALLGDASSTGQTQSPVMSPYPDAGDYFGARAVNAVPHSVIKPRPRHILTGHDDAVLCVAVSETFDLVASGSADGTIILHSLLSGLYVRTITKRAASTLSEGAAGAASSSSSAGGGSASAELRTPSRAGGGGGGGGGRQRSASVSGVNEARVNPPDVSWVAIAATGNIVSFSPDGDGIIESHTVNGRPLSWCATLRKSAVRDEALLMESRLEGPVYALNLSEDGHLVLSGGAPGIIVVRRVHSMEVVMRIGACNIPLDLQPPTFGKRRGTRGGGTAARYSEAGGEADVVPFDSAVRSLSFTQCEKHLFVGLQDGDLYIFTPDAQYLRERLRAKLQNLGL